MELTKEQRRIVRIVGFMEERGIQYRCACGRSHKILLSILEKKNGKICAKELVKLECMEFYKGISNLRVFSVKIDIESNGGRVKKLLTKAYVWLWEKYLNR